MLVSVALSRFHRRGLEIEHQLWGHGFVVTPTRLGVVCLLSTKFFVMFGWWRNRLYSSESRYSSSQVTVTIMPRSFRPRNIPCPVNGCNLFFTNRSGLRNHARVHRPFRRPAVPPAPASDLPSILPHDSKPPSGHNFVPPLTPPPPDDPHISEETVYIHPLINGVLSVVNSSAIGMLNEAAQVVHVI
jgi:hypothetical protein